MNREIEERLDKLEKALGELSDSISGHTRSQNTFVEWARMKEEALKPADVVSLFLNELITKEEARRLLRLPV